jgi:hypothetical protein
MVSLPGLKGAGAAAALPGLLPALPAGGSELPVPRPLLVDEVPAGRARALLPLPPPQPASKQQIVNSSTKILPDVFIIQPHSRSILFHIASGGIIQTNYDKDMSTLT